MGELDCGRLVKFLGILALAHDSEVAAAEGTAHQLVRKADLKLPRRTARLGVLEHRRRPWPPRKPGSPRAAVTPDFLADPSRPAQPVVNKIIDVIGGTY